MANSTLQGKYWDLPKEMISHLSKIFNAYRGNKTVGGYNRLEGILNNKTISYEQLKRIKNFFDTFKGTVSDTEYLLNGGTKMKNWVSHTLEKSRQDVSGKKKAMMNVGMDNQFQKDGGTVNQDSSGNRLKKQKTGVHEIKKLSNLLKLIHENHKSLIFIDK